MSVLNDGSSIYSSIYSSNATETSTSTVYGFGSLSGRAIKRLGESVLNGVDYIFVNRQLRKIETHFAGEWSEDETETQYMCGLLIEFTQSSRSLSIFSDPPPPYEESDPANRVLDVLSGPVCEEPTSTLSDDPPNPFSDYHRAQSHSRGSTNSAHRSSTSTFFAGVEGLTIGDTYYHRIGPNGIELTPHPGRDQVNGSASGHPSSGSTISNYNAPGAGVQSNYQGSGVSNVNWGRNQNAKEGPEGHEVHN
ncbi:hypothetical protein PQX77_003313 [Marasmius sp. AFHP31]|nr:hypothetical protein PQX77_003313 [Marasmius sp. AFHP31]